VNAAAGFDEHTLAPTYVLHVGIPGASAGISMALRLGLDPETIAAARQRLGTQAEDIGRFLDQLHRQITEIEGERQRLREREQAVAREQSRLSAEGMKEQRAKVRELEQKIESILKDFEYRMRETVRAIEDRAAQQKASRESERRIAQLRREFSEQFKATVVAHRTGADRDDPQAQPHVVRNVAVGDTVKLRSLGKNGEVRRQIDDNTFEVAVGAMKMRIARDDIAQVISAGGGSTSPLEAIRGSRGISVSMAGSGENFATELNVIGRTVDEATDELEKFLDRAFLSGSSRVRIVHGTGTGALRRALRAHLKSHPQVALVAEAPQNEGGGGATVVDLKL
jgi:DNA mismatch repair protein MutS2